MPLEDIVAFSFAFTALFVGARIAFPLVRAVAKRLEKRDGAHVPVEVASRLERMEQAIDSIAIEVERISEAQRFTTKLLSDKTTTRADRVE